MEDDTELELSLGLSCGGSSGKSKTKDAPSDPKVDEGGSNILIGGNMAAADCSFKNLFTGITENQDKKGKQKTAEVQQQNFWTDLRKHSTPLTDHSSDVQKNFTQFNSYQELWASNGNIADTEEERSNKRKMPFEDINLHNKHEKVAGYHDTHGKNPICVNLMRSSHAPVTVGDACSGVNEDVAESEAEGSSSWLVSQHEEKSKSSDVPKLNEKYVASESSGGPHGLKESPVSGSESNQEPGKVTYGIPLLRPITEMAAPYPVPAKLPTNANARNETGFSPSVIQPLSAKNSESSPVQTLSTSNLHLSFGYSPVQLPTLETGSSWAFSSPVPRHIPSVVSRDGALSTENSDGLKASHASVQALRSSPSGKVHEDKSLDFSEGRNHVAENGSYPQNADQSRAVFPFTRPKEKQNQPAADANPQGAVIRPGIAPEVKFGGSGSYPDLPWVSTTAPGPNGRTISGVTYKYSQNEIRIVCACHGTHMTPEKFVQHASADVSNPDNNAAMASLTSNNQAASA